ncbi:hypothetical protein CYMTET_23022 [Cymbomonas tetramitiformis]|uniref:Uncharacterized protein n=1 Tax=Cymbomonas tetramitiformis TaxID=36881 RepID=A0AAE0FYS5_9CHLO|nr:hypothetical protein CYMTET_23022 [Cymbomonas tetramitiformis]
MSDLYRYFCEQYKSRIRPVIIRRYRACVRWWQDLFDRIIGSKQNALQRNQEKKGQNSYYYAHKRRDTGEEAAPMPEPKLLHKGTRTIDGPSEDPGKTDVAAEHGSYYYAHASRKTQDIAAPMPEWKLLKQTSVKMESALQIHKMEKYYFTDEGDKVKVYFPLEGVGALAPEKTTSSFTKTSLKLEARSHLYPLAPNIHAQSLEERCRPGQPACSVHVAS